MSKSRISRQEFRRLRDVYTTEPTRKAVIAAALASGVVRDRSYNTVRYGWCPSFSGEGVVRMPGGWTYRVRGFEPDGDAQFCLRDGYVQVVRLK